VKVDDLDLVAQFTDAVRDSASVVPYGDGMLFALPWTLHDGEQVSILVEHLGGELVRLTDRGQAADTLSLSGIDLMAKRIAPSWDAVKKSINLAPDLSSLPTRFELAGTVEIGQVGPALVTLGEGVLRADGLHLLARTTRKRAFRDSLIHRATDRHLAVVPDAPLPTRFDSLRTVSFALSSHNSSGYFVQALAGANFGQAYDHTRSLFTDSSVAQDRLVAVVEDGAGEAWHRRSLREVALVLGQQEFDDFLSSVAA